MEGIAPGTALIVGTSSELLLWLYSRIDLTSDEPSAVLGRRLRGLCFTD
jgi:hypothetical protein